ncbi:MAG TPA: DUF494 family protein [Ignavibacteriales bacterium]|nr:DUF494 family protein [Ignavibacteriales bacterium]
MTPDRLISIIITLLEAEKSNISFNNIEKKLIKQEKFSRNEISAAYLFIQEKVKTKTLNKLNNRNFRIYTEDEINFLGYNNFQYLMTLRAYSILSDSDINKLINSLQVENITKLTPNIINNYIIYNFFGNKDFSFKELYNFYINPNDLIN